VRRRDFVIGIAGATTWPLATRAQQLDRMKRIGVLLLFAASDPETQVRVRVLEQALQTNGWRKGQGLDIEYRFAAGDFGRMRTLARELIELPVDVIVTNALSPIIAARQESRSSSIPIVFAMVANPFDQGLMGSLSHPDQNMTGVTGLDYPSIIGKWLELLKAIAPRVTRVGIMFNPDAYFPYLPPPPGSYWLRQLNAVASAFAVEPIAVPVHDHVEIRSAVAELSSESGGGLLVATDTFTVGYYRRIVSCALEHRLPGCYPYRYFAIDGGLLSYGPNGAEAFRQVASYVDLILRGANPRDLPIRRPTVFELTINLKTANVLGLTVPSLMLARADEVIE
jgi:putative tryptophan/tyrosine transport system substrate-binding protein